MAGDPIQDFLDNLSASTGVPISAGDYEDLARRNPEDLQSVMAAFEDQYDRRAAPTASAGGSGGDLDLNGDAIIDAGWYLVDAQPGDPGFARAGESVNPADVARAVNVDVGGANAASLFDFLAGTSSVRVDASNSGLPANARTAVVAAPQAPGNTRTATNVAANPLTVIGTSGTLNSPQSASSGLVQAASTAGLASITGGGNNSILLIAAAVAAWFYFKR